MSDLQDLQNCLKELSCSDSQFEKLQSFVSLLREWNENINLVSRADMDQLVSKHVAESMEFARLDVWTDVKHVLDIGTGGGFPGIPLAILHPEISFDLIDARKKKTVFLDTAVAILGLKNVKVLWGRVEELDKNAYYNVMTARAVTNLPQLWKWTKKLLIPGGVLITPKGKNEVEHMDRSVAQSGIVQKIDYPTLPFTEKVFVLVRKKG